MGQKWVKHCWLPFHHHSPNLHLSCHHAPSVRCSGVGSGPAPAACTTVESLSIDLLDLRRSRWSRSRLPGLDILWSFISIAISTFALVIVRGFTWPMSRFVALVTDSFLGKSGASGWRLGLNEVENLCSGDWSCHILECSWWSLGVASVSCRWPLLPVKQCPVGILCVGKDVLVGQRVDLHVKVGCFLVFESNVQYGLLHFLLDRSQGKAIFFKARTTSHEKVLQHAHSEVVVILTSSCQLICILVDMSGQLLMVFSRVLTWEPSLDDGLQIFKPLNGSGLDGLEELEPHHLGGVRMI